MEDKVSIIVPVYNMEKYLCRCIDSILNQTYKNLQVILVDDGSSDSSLTICNAYKEKDKRVEVVTKSNGGLSSARNCGLMHVTGEYVCFIDSDDFIDNRFIEVLLKNIKEYNADISCVRFLYFKEKEDISANFSCRNKIKVVDSKQYLKNILSRKSCEAVWNKMFRKKTIEKKFFKEGVLNEDFLFLSELLYKKSLKIVCSNFSGYFYYTRNGSISNSGYSKSIIDAVYNALFVKEMVCDKNLKNYANTYLLYTIRTAIVLMPKEVYINNGEFVLLLKEQIKLLKGKILKSKLKIKDKIFCLYFSLFPDTAKKLADVFHRGK